MRKTHNKFTKIQMEEMRSKFDVLSLKEKEDFTGSEFIQGLEGTIRSLTMIEARIIQRAQKTHAHKQLDAVADFRNAGLSSPRL